MQSEDLLSKARSLFAIQIYFLASLSCFIQWIHHLVSHQSKLNTHTNPHTHTMICVPDSHIPLIRRKLLLHTWRPSTQPALVNKDKAVYESASDDQFLSCLLETHSRRWIHASHRYVSPCTQTRHRHRGNEEAFINCCSSTALFSNKHLTFRHGGQTLLMNTREDQSHKPGCRLVIEGLKSRVTRSFFILCFIFVPDQPAVSWCL